MHDDATALSLIEEIQGPKAWKRDTISPADWLVPLPEASVVEIETALARLGEAPAPLESLDPAGPAFSSCGKVMAEVRKKLVDGPGLAVVDRVPVERYSVSENRAIAWLLGSMLGRIVDQKRDGTPLYDVRDSGQALGYGVRRSVTNLDQPFHTDGPWLWMPPAFVGLLCVHPAAEGGVSRLVSLVTVHNELRDRHPALLTRLYRAFRWDRQAEHPPEEQKFSTNAVFHYDGRDLVARYYEDYVWNGYRLAGETLDAGGQEALAAMGTIVNDIENWAELLIERGQLQYINNRQFAHNRTEFRDGPDPEHRRHMIRIWNRDEGTRRLEGQGSV